MFHELFMNSGKLGAFFALFPASGYLVLFPKAFFVIMILFVIFYNNGVNL